MVVGRSEQTENKKSQISKEVHKVISEKRLSSFNEHHVFFKEINVLENCFIMPANILPLKLARYV